MTSKQLHELPAANTLAPEDQLLISHAGSNLTRRASLGSLSDGETLVFGTRNGTKLDSHNVRRAFRRIVAAAGLDPAAWTPRELRHSFVSLLSDSGMPLEQIARLLGHNGTAVTERVYRHQLRPVLEDGAAAMDGICSERPPR